MNSLNSSFDYIINHSLNKFDCLKQLSQIIYNDIFSAVYNGNYEYLNKISIIMNEKIKIIDDNNSLSLTLNYNILKNILINIFELKSPMINLDLLQSIIN